jgi:hypothetical protein
LGWKAQEVYNEGGSARGREGNWQLDQVTKPRLKSIIENYTNKPS